MFKRILIAGLLFGMAGTAPPLQAQGFKCGLRTMIVERLQAQYAEEFTGGGLQSSQTATAIIEVWTSPATGTFTVLLTNPNGMSCIVAAGTDWFAETVKPVKDGVPS